MPISITIDSKELYDEKQNLFIEIPSRTIVLEHSLLSISKWESKWHKPYLSRTKKSREEWIDYVRCMTISGVCKPEYYYGLNSRNIKEIERYINDPMTATTIRRNDKKIGNEIITSELIYYWMVALNIPFSCEKWHLNRLLTFIEVVSIKNKPSKMMSKNSIMKQNSAINRARRAKHGTKG